MTQIYFSLIDIQSQVKRKLHPKLLNQAAKQSFVFSIICKSLMIRLKYEM